MKVYFTASVSAGRKFRQQYQLVVNTLRDIGLEVLSANTAEDEFIESKLRLKSDIGMTSEEIFLREKAEIEACDFVVSEATQPSMGNGFLIGHALYLQKTVLALVYNDNDNKISSFIKGIPSSRFFIEHYTEDNIKIVLKNFLKYIENNNKRQGKMIVIDGSDSSGKKTQSQLLLDFLGKENKKTRYIDFPRYYSSFHGQTVARYLRGEFGPMSEVNPYLSSLAYALDRLFARDQIEHWLIDGNTVVSNRYVASSLAFQSARVEETERENFINWIYNMEYKEHRLPKEDILIYLYVPVEISQKLIDKREKHKYLNGNKKDIHEENLDYLKEVEKMYLSLVDRYPHWVKVDCIDKKGKMRTKEDIHEEVIEILKAKSII